MHCTPAHPPSTTIWPTATTWPRSARATYTHGRGGESRNWRHTPASSAPRPRVDSTAQVAIEPGVGGPLGCLRPPPVVRRVLDHPLCGRVGDERYGVSDVVVKQEVRGKRRWRRSSADQEPGWGAMAAVELFALGNKFRHFVLGPDRQD